MADSPPNDSGRGPRVGPDRTSPPGTPRWVKLFGIIAAVVVVVVIVILALAGGEHGPGRHLRDGGNRGDTLRVQHTL
jgi:hypothetical protein